MQLLDRISEDGLTINYNGEDWSAVVLQEAITHGEVTEPVAYGLLEVASLVCKTSKEEVEKAAYSLLFIL